MKKKVEVRVKCKTEYKKKLEDILTAYKLLGKEVYYIRDKERCYSCILNDDCDSQWLNECVIKDVISDFWIGEETGGRVEFYLRNTPCHTFHLDDFGKVLFFDKDDINLKGE